MTIWIVVKYWPGGRRENAAAYTSEENARYYAGRIVGQDGALIALETIEVNKTDEDLPTHEER
jgi:hypothetical protein